MPFSVPVELLAVAAPFGVAIGLSALLTPLVGRWALKTGVVARPRQDRWHSQPTPLLGGVAIYLAATAAILLFAPMDRRTWGLLAGGTVLFATGLVDDLRHLRPHIKLIVQILAALAMVVGGIQVETETLAAVAVPLTVLWVVGLTNAFNLLDNMDGLSAGTAAIAAGFLFAFSVSVGNVALAVLCAAVAGAALGFLAYNFHPARIFMGDSGSMFLGFTLAGITLLGSREMASDVFFVLLVPAAMMALPIFDTTLVTIIRTLEGRPLSEGGRDHVSHRLVALGLSERQAVILLYAVAAGFGSLGLVGRQVGMWASLAIGGALLVGAVLFGAFLAQVRLYAPGQADQAERAARASGSPIVNGMIMYKREIGLAALDFGLICVAYLGAFLLRFGYKEYSDPGSPWPLQFSESLPYVVGVKLVLLLALRAYRGMLRYVGMADLLLLGKASLLSSLALVPLVPFVLHNTGFPRSILVIDWLLFTTMLVASRVSFAALTDTFAGLRASRVPAVLIVGAGDLGELVARSLIRAPQSAYQAVGFLDPDASKVHRSIHGVPVLGALDRLEQVVVERDVEMVVVALNHAELALAAEVQRRARALGVSVYPAAAFVERHFAGGAADEASVPAQPEIEAILRRGFGDDV